MTWKRLNTETDQKNEETDQKYWESPQKYWEIPLKYLNKIRGNGYTILGNLSKKGGNSSKLEFRGTSKKFEEIAEMPQKPVIEGFPRIFDPFPC